MANQNRRDDAQNRRQKFREKRQARRIKRSLIVQYRIEDQPLGKVDISQAKDLSENGIFFTISRAIPAQTVLDIRLQLPTQRESLVLAGRTLSCEEIKKNFIYGIRVEFINLKDEQRKILQKFVQASLKVKGK